MKRDLYILQSYMIGEISGVNHRREGDRRKSQGVLRNQACLRIPSPEDGQVSNSIDFRSCYVSGLDERTYVRK